MDIIQLLPDNVANQIAAGEVIQRPSSVIKELVENSVDAGATTIKVLVVDAGRSSIQVIDDGCGMSDTDARLSFERHATSKIKKAEDLFSLRTMGFRGEALASIASVAQVTLQSRQKDEELGTKITIDGSKFVSQEPVSCPVGSNFLVENLFFNIPARRKFLKSNNTEMSHILQTFERIVLVNPQISFYLYNNGQKVMDLPATSLRQRILDVIGRKINPSLLPLNSVTTLCEITGFVGKPESAKKKGAKQFFFVNDRFMKHAYFHKAVMMAFERLVPQGEQVPYFIYLKVNPSDIDVNIHPVKTEIKFDNEQAIWQIIMAAVRDAVGRYSGVTQIDFDTEGKPDIPVLDPNTVANLTAPECKIDQTYNPFDCTPDQKTDGMLDEFRSASSFSASLSPSTMEVTGAVKGSKVSYLPSSSLGITDNRKKNNTENWREIYKSVEDNDLITDNEKVVATNLFDSNEFKTEGGDDLDARGKEHLQFNGRYILTQVSGGILIVDQHRAEVRILFEEYMKRFDSTASYTQKMLFPEVVQFPMSYASMLEPVLEEMCCLGFEITNIGGGSYSITGVPAGLIEKDAMNLVSELVSAAVEYGSDVKEEINALLSLELAQRTAKPYGEVLTQEKMEELMQRLFACENYRYALFGKTIMAVVPTTDIETLFNK